MHSTLSKNIKHWYKAVSIIMIALVVASCGARKPAVSAYQTTTIQDDLLAYSKKYLGKPYRYAGKGPESFDCSGFTSFVFRNFGYRLNASSAGQDRQVPTVARKEELQVGDLVFFEGRRHNGRVGHVGIVSEKLPNGQFRFIHASTTSGVIVSNSTEPYYASRYLRGGRVLEENATYATRQNPAIKHPHKSTYPVSIDQSGTAPDIAEVTPNKDNGTKSQATHTANATVRVERESPRGPTEEAGKNTRKNASIVQANNDVVLRETGTEIPSPPVNHEVKMGETLYGIARRYGCTVEQLKAWNPHLKGTLKAGETLVIYENGGQ